MTKKTVTLRVTARAGRRIAGYGSRQMGETIDVPEEVAAALANDPGLEVVTPSRASKGKSAPAPTSVDKEQTDAS